MKFSLDKSYSGGPILAPTTWNSQRSAVQGSEHWTRLAALVLTFIHKVSGLEKTLTLSETVFPSVKEKEEMDLKASTTFSTHVNYLAASWLIFLNTLRDTAAKQSRGLEGVNPRWPRPPGSALS